MNRYLFLIIASFLCLSCTEKAKEVPHVILIGSDGFSSTVIRGNPGAFPNIEKLMEQGSYTLERRSVLPSSSAVNWASMLMGACPELHGYTTWGSETPELPSRITGQYGIFPSITGLIREKYPDAVMGCAYTWPTIGCLYEQEPVNWNYNAPDDQALCDNICGYIKDHNPLFTFISFGEPDGIGHNIGWESEEFLEGCKVIDKYVGDIMNSIKEAGMEGNSIVIFTSDHGGTGTGHGGKTMPEMEAPFIVAGKGIRKGCNITESVMVYDCASTIAHIFGLDQPQVWIGRPIMSIFEQ